MDCWPEAEVPMNVNSDELGNLGLTTEEELALVAFMETLSDGYRPMRGGNRSMRMDSLRSERETIGGQRPAQIPGRR
jgi:hypothetical protein